MDTNLFKILDQAISHCQTKVSAGTLLTILHNFKEVMRVKLQNDADIRNTDLEIKLENARNRKAVLQKQIHKLRADYHNQVEFKNEIVAQNCTLIIQQQQNYQILSSKERNIARNTIVSKQKELQEKKERIYKTELSLLNAQLEENRLNNMQNESKARDFWDEKKQKLNEVLLEYDTKMSAQQEELEMVRCTLDREKEELHDYKAACADQEDRYTLLMKEREEYLDQQRQKKLHEIRVRIAKRTIVKFIEDHYPAWKKKKLKTSKKRGKFKFSASKKK